MKWLTIITISLLLFGCNSEEEPFAGIVVGKKYTPPAVVLVYNPVLKIMTPSRKKCKYVIYAANSEELKAFEVEKDITSALLHKVTRGNDVLIYDDEVAIAKALDYGVDLFGGVFNKRCGSCKDSGDSGDSAVAA